VWGAPARPARNLLDPSGDVLAGVERLLTEYAELETGDTVFIAYTPDSRESAALVGLACEAWGITAGYVPYGPLKDPGFRARLAAAAPDVPGAPGKCVLITFERDTMSHHGDIRAHFAARAPDRYRVIRAINAGPDLFAVGLAMGPRQLSALNAGLLEKLRSASRLVIRTPGGTDLRVRLDNEKFRFISNRGVAQPRQFVILPAGEVATYPAEINGTLVADFAVNVNMIYEGDVRLAHQPVIARIEDGMLADLKAADSAIGRFLERSFTRTNARRVGELGFGTNTAVKNAVFENSHLNERVPGVHLGFGQHNQANAATQYECDIHVDLCAKGGQIWFDDDPVPLDLEALRPSDRPHPGMARDEDVFSEEFQVEDCCGLTSNSPSCVT
jgi:hypothetical protein